MPRLFTAIEIPETVQREIVRIQPRDLVDGALTAPNQMHLTLHFIGEITDPGAASLQATFHVVRFTPFSLKLSVTGCFAADNRPGFLWVGVDRSPQLLALHHEIGQALQSLGIPLEDRPYLPHVTIARLDSPQNDATRLFLKETESFRSSFDVSSFTLHSVERVAGAASYEKQAEYRSE